MYVLKSFTFHEPKVLYVDATPLPTVHVWHWLVGTFHARWQAEGENVYSLRISNPLLKH
jgi:hypothetical protein